MSKVGIEDLGDVHYDRDYTVDFFETVYKSTAIGWSYQSVMIDTITGDVHCQDTANYHGELVTREHYESIDLDDIGELTLALTTLEGFKLFIAEPKSQGLLWLARHKPIDTSDTERISFLNRASEVQRRMSRGYDMQSVRDFMQRNISYNVK
jgi:hypothetical protein